MAAPGRKSKPADTTGRRSSGSGRALMASMSSTALRSDAGVEDQLSNGGTQTRCQKLSAALSRERGGSSAGRAMYRKSTLLHTNVKPCASSLPNLSSPRKSRAKRSNESWHISQSVKDLVQGILHVVEAGHVANPTMKRPHVVVHCMLCFRNANCHGAQRLIEGAWDSQVLALRPFRLNVLAFGNRRAASCCSSSVANQAGRHAAAD